MSKKNIVGILLAGGMGSRLKELTDTVPKPALFFGGKYRIIDFVLSNCTNSGIDTLGIITQYEPIELTSYIGIGSAWDLDIFDGGITVLPPYTSKKEGFYWQKGTAHAVYQHINYLDLYHPDYVLILSTDHIYKMDYSLLLHEHIKNEADITISSIRINKKEANRFGIIKTNELNKVISFEEKPYEPQGEIASMGIYVFNYKLLKELLIKFNSEENSEIDFGKHIIPYMINNYQVYAYEFNDYWQDIGTIESLWKANMDLIDNPDYLRLSDKKWPIFSNTIHLPSHHIASSSLIRNSFLCEGTLIKGNVYHSVISSAVLIEENTTIINSVVLPNVSIGKNCYIKNTIIKMNATIPDNTIIDNDNEIVLVTKYNLKCKN